VELVVVEGPDQGRSFALTAESVIGRDPTATVHLTDEEVSRRHALLSIGEGRAILEDLGSSNGTYVDGELVTGESQLQPGARLTLGATVLEFRRLEGSEDPENLKATKTNLRPPPPR
jgi:pSer/pThr/pTyr-binding forkhead associated (FHA) protein